jgi:hypothetical protein
MHSKRSTYDRFYRDVGVLLWLTGGQLKLSQENFGFHPLRSYRGCISELTNAIPRGARFGWELRIGSFPAFNQFAPSIMMFVSVKARDM